MERPLAQIQEITQEQQRQLEEQRAQHIAKQCPDVEGQLEKTLGDQLAKYDPQMQQAIKETITDGVIKQGGIRPRIDCTYTTRKNDCLHIVLKNNRDFEINLRQILPAITPIPSPDHTPSQQMAVIPAPEPPKYKTYEPNDKEKLFIVRHPFIAYEIGEIKKGQTNISTNAHRFARQGTGAHALQYEQPDKNTEKTQVNAFRHTLWQATIAGRHGTDIAKEVGDAHETNPNAHLKTQRTFATMGQADQVADLLNNEIGRRIGQANPNLNMREQALLVLDEFYQTGLNTLTKDGNGQFNVQKTRITTQQYNYMKQLYQSLDENGN